MSLQTGSELARTGEPIIDPRSLTIVAFYVEGNLLAHDNSVLHVSDIREIGDLGVIIDDSDKLMAVDGLVRLQQIIDFRFSLTGVKVIDEQGHKLGKVNDFVIEPESYTVQQMYTEQGFLKSLSTISNIIHRSQIVSVTNQLITVRATTIPDKETAVSKVTEAFVNPFRSKPQQETIENNSKITLTGN